MIICEVRQGGATYVFKSKYLIKKGTWVLCDTSRGTQPGVVIDSFTANGNTKLFNKYLDAMGAYKPLKEVIGMFVSVETLDEIRKRNRK